MSENDGRYALKRSTAQVALGEMGSTSNPIDVGLDNDPCEGGLSDRSYDTDNNSEGIIFRGGRYVREDFDSDETMSYGESEADEEESDYDIGGQSGNDSNDECPSDEF